MSPLSTPHNRRLFLGAMFIAVAMTLISAVSTYFASREAQALFNERVKIAKNTRATDKANAEAEKAKLEARKAKQDAELMAHRVEVIEKRIREGNVPEKLDRVIEFLETTTGVPRREIAPPKPGEPRP